MKDATKNEYFLNVQRGHFSGYARYVKSREAHDVVALSSSKEHATFKPGDEIKLFRESVEHVGTYTVNADGTVTYKSEV